jgi:hypothetical protein
MVAQQEAQAEVVVDLHLQRGLALLVKETMEAQVLLN